MSWSAWTKKAKKKKKIRIHRRSCIGQRYQCNVHDILEWLATAACVSYLQLETMVLNTLPKTPARQCFISFKTVAEACKRPKVGIWNPNVSEAGIANMNRCNQNKAMSLAWLAREGNYTAHVHDYPHTYTQANASKFAMHNYPWASILSCNDYFSSSILLDPSSVLGMMPSFCYYQHWSLAPTNDTWTK